MAGTLTVRAILAGRAGLARLQERESASRAGRNDLRIVPERSAERKHFSQKKNIVTDC
jgi:hypothetical protein